MAFGCFYQNTLSTKKSLIWHHKKPVAMSAIKNHYHALFHKQNHSKTESIQLIKNFHVYNSES